MKVLPEHLDTGTKTQATSRQYVRTMGSPSDHAGHVLARKLGGSGTEKQNLVPLHPATNRELYDKVEKKVAEAVRKHGAVQYSLKFIYNADDTRPHTICYCFNYMVSKDKMVEEEGSLSNRK